MKKKLKRYGKLTFGLLMLAIFLMVAVNEGRSQDQDTRWIYRTIRQQYWAYDHWTGQTVLRHRYVTRRYPNHTYHLPEVRVYGYARRGDDRHDDRDRGRGRCLTTHKAIGSERYDKEKAKEDARQQWASLVRFHHGVVFMDLSNARDVVFSCSKSATGERASEKAAAVLSGGSGLQQCEVEARPCRAERVLDRDER